MAPTPPCGRAVPCHSDANAADLGIKLLIPGGCGEADKDLRRDQSKTVTLLCTRAVRAAVRSEQDPESKASSIRIGFCMVTSGGFHASYLSVDMPSAHPSKFEVFGRPIAFLEGLAA